MVGRVMRCVAAARIGDENADLAEDEIRHFVHAQLDAIALDGRSVCVLVPDATRTCPVPLLLSAVHGALHGRVSRLTVLVALGTHAGMDERARATHLGYRPGEPGATYPATEILDHAWWDPSTFVDIGVVPAERVAQLSGGLLRHDATVRVNRAVVEHDVVLVVGPVFPHEVAGFSGGNKYLFPGVSGRELIDLSHWVGALVGSAQIIGVTGPTPVRALIDEAASMLSSERLAFCAVTRPGSDGLHALSFGDTVGAWAAVVDTAAASHIRYLDTPVRRVLSILPERYADMWTGAKGFYKVEPVVADGGEVVILAPHIREVSAMHPEIAEIGYHCRDYFVKQWDRFRSRSWGDLAHCTHLRGAGTYDPTDGERARVTVTLATAIPEHTVSSVNLDYIDPGAIDIDAWADDPGTLVVRDAGEELYRLRPSPS
ncbi:MAG TPA: lactate racemase domain-containing protein [Acidimicrobiales bacterium]|nr:lactate racemase domain-containing protein [Acidimicrobiales bacterium]